LPTQRNDEKNFEFGQSTFQVQSAVCLRTCDNEDISVKFDFSDSQTTKTSRTISLISLFLSASAFVVPNARRGTAMPLADLSVDPSCTAFVFVEYQNEFTTERGKLHDAVKDVMEKTGIT
jgi:hypothetical protein